MCPWLCKQGQCFGEDRNRALLFWYIELFRSAYGAISISNLAPEYKTWLYEVHHCLMIFTSISYPISLDCISSTKKVAASGQKAENTKNKAWEIKISTVLLQKIQQIFFTDMKMILSIENIQKISLLFLYYSLKLKPIQEQYGVLISHPQILANSQLVHHHTEYHSKFVCVLNITIIAL